MAGTDARRKLLAVAVACAAGLAPLGAPVATSARVDAHAAAAPVPAFTHVVEVMLENESATSTFEDSSAAPGLARLRSEGVYIPGFYGVGHASLDNYEAAFGGVQPTPQGEGDCLGMPYGNCIFPASVPTLGALLDAHDRSWKIYSEGMSGAPGGHNCLHSPSRQSPDPYQGPGTNGYATRHNPAPWFDSVLEKGASEAYCQAHSVDLTQLWTDAASPQTLPSWSFVEPDTCHNGHDGNGCMGDPEGPGAPSGVAAIDAWLPGFVARLESSPAWDAGSLLVITFDEGDSSDTSGCAPCHDGSAGGRIGALLIGHDIAHPGTTSSWQGDHYSLLRTWETAWGLPSLKSLAASSAAATTVHDGDPGVTPITGVWLTPPPPGPPPCKPRALRLSLGRRVVSASAYIKGRKVAHARGHVITIRHPPARSFTVRVRVRLSGGALRWQTIRVRLAPGCRLVRT